MSQVVTLKRKILKTDLDSALNQTNDLSLGQEHNWGFEIKYTRDPNILITFCNGELEATSPSDTLYQELERLATLLDADLIHEDEVSIRPNKTVINEGKEIVLFWPLLIAILSILLIWRW